MALILIWLDQDGLSFIVMQIVWPCKLDRWSPERSLETTPLLSTTVQLQCISLTLLCDIQTKDSETLKEGQALRKACRPKTHCHRRRRIQSTFGGKLALSVIQVLFHDERLSTRRSQGTSGRSDRVQWILQAIHKP